MDKRLGVGVMYVGGFCQGGWCLLLCLPDL